MIPDLTFKHQISQMDHRALSGGIDGIRGIDRAIVQVQLADVTGAPVGVWIKLEPYINAYDTQDNNVLVDCSFDPVDDGNTEEDFFDPSDPQRVTGPSSTCFPERTFVDQGDTGAPFDPDNIGDASDGPGLEGSTGLGTWIEARFSLAPYRGRRINLRFLETGLNFEDSPDRTWEEAFTFNPDPRDDGWFIDDVRVANALTVPATVTVDSKENTEIKQDFDFDGVGATCDCAPEDPQAWIPALAVTDLRLAHSGGIGGATTLTWEPPRDIGGAFAGYDTLRSLGPNTFRDVGFTICVETSDSTDASAVDAATPDPYAVYHFLVRASHTCGDPLGTDSSGQPRIGIACH